jgi:hypothetical protein
LVNEEDSAGGYDVATGSAGGSRKAESRSNESGAID